MGKDRIFHIECLLRRNASLTYAVELTTDLVVWRTGQLEEEAEELDKGWERVTTSYTPPGFARVGYARVGIQP